MDVYAQLLGLVAAEKRTRVRLALPCTAANCASDAVCHVFEALSFWNRCLWYVGLQLRELTVPGELSLVRVRGQGCGREQEGRSHDGRLLFHALLTRHRCVVSLDLDEAIIEGGELGECRNLVLRAFQQNSTVQKLSLGVFRENDFIQQELFAAVAAKTNLHELQFVGSGEFLGLVNPLSTLLVDPAANISTLSIPGICFDEEHSDRLVTALEGNDTVLELSVDVSILCSLLPNGTARFSYYLANCGRLRALTVTADVDRQPAAYAEVKSIVEPFVPRCTIVKLKLIGFLLDEDCARLFSRLLTSNGALESLDIMECEWIRVEPFCPASTIPPENERDLRCAGPAFSRRVRPWVVAFTENTTLKFLAISLSGLTADDFGAFFRALRSVGSIDKVFVSGVGPEDLPQAGRVIRDTGMSDKVSVCEQYFVSPALLKSLDDSPEVLREAAVSSARTPSADVCCETLQELLPFCWFQVTTLRLYLSQEVLGHIMFRAIFQCLNEATGLKELQLTGCGEPELSLLPGTQLPNPVLRILFSPSIRALRLSAFRFGLANLRFLAQAVTENRRLCKFSFSSCDSAENATLLRFLAGDLAANEIMLHLRVSQCREVDMQAYRSIIQDVLSRNMGLVTCAAHFVVSGVRIGRCVDALHRVSDSSALVSKVQELASVDEAEAMAMIQSRLTVT